MSRLELRLYPEAIAEAREARIWYRSQNPTVAEEFVRELRLSLRAVVEAPQRWPILWAGFQRLRLRRFPYMIVYRIRGATLEVIAIAHLRRRPGYWKNRRIDPA